MTTLRAHGVRFALDDFGTGYSSLSYLRRFPLDVLKLDRSFVRGIGGDECATAIVTAVVQMAQALDLTVVAEGVETAPELRALEALGCELIEALVDRSYLFSELGQLVQRCHPLLLLRHRPRCLRLGRW